MTVLAARKLQARPGYNAAAVLKDYRRGGMICRCEPITEAELAHAARHEQVRTLADAFRRVGMAAGPCAGAGCVLRAAGVIGGELGWGPAPPIRGAPRVLSCPLVWRPPRPRHF